MKRNMELIREILMKVEEIPTPSNFDLIEIPGHEQEEISYHVKLLGDAGFLDVYDLRTLGPNGYKYAPIALTNAGHDLLDSMRSESVWKKAKAKLSEVGGSASMDVIQSVLASIIRNTLAGS